MSHCRHVAQRAAARPPPELGERVRFARQANRQTQAVVAGLSGITTDYLHQIEHGRKLPTLPVVVRLARVLRVPVSSLLGEALATALQPARPPTPNPDHQGRAAPAYDRRRRAGRQP
nr:helix-turn-helix transcriptional regulator [Actinophytocola sp.]